MRTLLNRSSVSTRSNTLAHMRRVEAAYFTFELIRYQRRSVPCFMAWILWTLLHMRVRHVNTLSLWQSAPTT